MSETCHMPLCVLIMIVCLVVAVISVATRKSVEHADEATNGEIDNDDSPLELDSDSDFYPSDGFSIT